MFENTDIITALVTPFDCHNQINYDALQKLVDRLLREGGNGFLIGGTTGETPTLTHDEKINLYQHFVKIVAGRAPIIAGTGSNSTAATIEFTQEVSKIDGIDAALVVVPYYNKPDQVGMKAHFKAVADASDLPIIMYNIPGRTGVTMDVETIVELSQYPNIVGVKQCGTMPEFEELVEKTPTDFLVYTGEDPQALFTRTVGGSGVISVASHLYMPEMREMFDAMGHYLTRAGQLQRYLTPKMQALFMYPSPSPVKFMLSRNGLNVGGCRLPITNLNESEQHKLLQALGEKELIND
ncbi:4-hydroxy-tetrahydrodipicolinate synthase [Fructilactobacillus lindneri]|uniref:4-hydroxy-tetrahydrodipicolinate synthase n=1 Tax=Fructilactobacillus lindneri DSM 20690 = JCM 11027 TaxID=1122148 RepID=A0A0R2JVN6_9LACO|nr:4-hydroxy-tetrahydrodipicolinate synthase [Fructilactobacillus lindneri]ANZ57668.1 4-hydroxy-tetrahydrodipicolinate synthase [Fructilactobacillus lindneri]KRN78404.1 dihydrodipicolinate synthase [Fructilactobacillus lindneri DSM 20690 = JCM 11027]POG97965.1 4-hydroxy-tetrahydrodipicolinate synthase [Fructilactobacillus lindneri]POG99017.1 4-hydroxy-tetrahydrodipicolinate synthase [Fructilactobacillus lindneri]POH01509.1 4-hydroxy-tetrahydrodipicolinate synthase [Fructilactobacillus lindneri